MTKQDNQAPADKQREDKPSTKPASFAELFNRARRQANRGDERARAALKQYLDGHPDAVERFGNLARMAEEALLENVSAGDWFVQEAVRRDAANRRKDLAGPAANLLESMAVERAVACWMGLQNVKMSRNQARSDFASLKYWDQREEQATRLYDAALRSLALVRGPLAAPAQPTAVQTGDRGNADHVDDRAHQAVSTANNGAPQHDMGLQPTGASTPVNHINGMMRKVNGHVRVPATAGGDN